MNKGLVGSHIIIQICLCNLLSGSIEMILIVFIAQTCQCSLIVCICRMRSVYLLLQRNTFGVSSNDTLDIGGGEDSVKYFGIGFHQRFLCQHVGVVAMNTLVVGVAHTVQLVLVETETELSHLHLILTTRGSNVNKVILITLCKRLVETKDNLLITPLGESVESIFTFVQGNPCT